MTTPSDYTSAKHAAAYYGVTTQTLRRWAKAGKINSFKTPSGQSRYQMAGRPTAKVEAPKPVAAPVEVKAIAPVEPKPAKPKAVKPTPLEKAIAAAPKMDPATLSRSIDALTAP